MNNKANLNQKVTGALKNLSIEQKITFRHTVIERQCITWLRSIGFKLEIREDEGFWQAERGGNQIVCNMLQLDGYFYDDVDEEQLPKWKHILIGGDMPDSLVGFQAVVRCLGFCMTKEIDLKLLGIDVKTIRISKP